MHLLLGLLVVSVGASVGILSVWAGTSRRHWFLRTIVVALPLGVLLLVPAYEPFVALVVEAVVVAAGLSAVRWIEARRHATSETNAGSVRFSVKSVLCVMLLVGVSAAIGVRLPELSVVAWLNTVHVGAALGVAVLLGWWLACGRTSWRRRVPTAVVASVVVAVPLTVTDYLLDSFAFGGAPWPPPGPSNVAPPYSAPLHWLWLELLPAVSLATGLWLTLTMASSARNASQQLSRTRQTLRTAATIVWSVLLLVLPTYVLYRTLSPTPIPERDYPQPNGWNLLAAATRAIQSPVLEEPDAATSAALETAVVAHRRAYDQFRKALAHESLAPFNFHDKFLGGRRLTELQDFRGLARAVIAEGRSAEFAQRPEEAAATYADVIELSERATSGGMLIHALVGGAIQNLANDALTKIRRRLPEATGERLARRLWQIDARREPFDSLLANDRIWMEHALGWHGRTTLALADFAGEELELHALVRRAYLRATTLTRLIIAELAVATYTAKYGEPPAKLEMLVPAVLPAQVIDPFSNEPLRYRREGEEWLIYSVGYDGRDEGGRSPNDEDYLGWKSGDMSLDNWQEWSESQ